MSFNASRENKILAKISDFTVGEMYIGSDNVFDWLNKMRLFKVSPVCFNITDISKHFIKKRN